MQRRDDKDAKTPARYWYQHMDANVYFNKFVPLVGEGIDSNPDLARYGMSLRTKSKTNPVDGTVTKNPANIHNLLSIEHAMADMRTYQAAAVYINPLTWASNSIGVHVNPSVLYLYFSACVTAEPFMAY